LYSAGVVSNSSYFVSIAPIVAVELNFEENVEAGQEIVVGYQMTFLPKKISSSKATDKERFECIKLTYKNEGVSSFMCYESVIREGE